MQTLFFTMNDQTVNNVIIIIIEFNSQLMIHLLKPRSIYYYVPFCRNTRIRPSHQCNFDLAAWACAVDFDMHPQLVGSMPICDGDGAPFNVHSLDHRPVHSCPSVWYLHSYRAKRKRTTGAWDFLGSWVYGTVRAVSLGLGGRMLRRHLCLFAASWE